MPLVSATSIFWLLWALTRYFCKSPFRIVLTTRDVGSMRRGMQPPHMVANWGTRDSGLDQLIFAYQVSHG
jgi:hypothetical protein